MLLFFSNKNGIINILQGMIQLIEIIKVRATPEQIKQMLQELKFYIKVAVDLERQILAGGGEMHFYCEQALLEDGKQVGGEKSKYISFCEMAKTQPQ